MTQIIELKSLGDLYPDAPIPLSRDIYFCFTPYETNPYLAHVCTHSDGTPRWEWRGTQLHTLVCREPLHLEASIGWTDCCGRHGFIRGGKWEPAGDGGWSAPQSQAKGER